MSGLSSSVARSVCMPVARSVAGAFGSSNQLLLDALPGATFAASVWKLSKNFSGNIATIRRESDDALASIGLAGNVIDSSAIASHTGGNWYFKEMLDQSGGSGKLIQATIAKQPKGEADSNGVIGPRYGISALNVMDSSGISPSQPFTLYLMFNGEDHVGEHELFTHSAYPPFAPHLKIESATWIWNGSNGVPQSTFYGGIYGVEKLAIVCDGTSSYLYFGDRVFGPVDIGTGGFENGLRLGCSIFDDFQWKGFIYLAAIYPEAHSAGQVATAFGSLGYPVQQTPLLIFEGDSLTFGQAEIFNYPDICVGILAAASVPVDHVSKAQFGDSLITGTIQSEFYYQCVPYMTSMRTCITVEHSGTNDINTGQTAAAIYAKKLLIWNMARAHGSLVVTSTMIARSTFDAAAQVQWQENNTLIRGDSSVYDGMFDIGAASQFDEIADTSDTTYYLDGIHCSEAGYTIFAQLAADQIQLLL